jgi:hypothetical protein
MVTRLESPTSRVSLFQENEAELDPTIIINHGESCFCRRSTESARPMEPGSTTVYHGIGTVMYGPEKKETL